MRVLIAAGGTAGHINPALAIAGALKAADPTAEIHFAGRREGMEYGLVTKAGYPFHHIEINGFQRHLNLENIGRNIVAIWHLALSGPRTRKILNEVNPDLVIGCGGYVSGPIVRAAAKRGIKTAIHEQNAFPGVTNKLLAKEVNIVLAASADAVEKLGAPEKTTVVGNPVRPEVLTADRATARAKLNAGDRTVILSFGGSLGADRINQVVADLCAWEKQTNQHTLHLHATGSRGVKLFENLIEVVRCDGVADLEVEVRVRVEKAGEQQPAADVDHLGLRAGKRLADGLDAFAVDEQIGFPAAGSADDHAAFQQLFHTNPLLFVDSATPHHSASAFGGYFSPVHRFGKFDVHKARPHFPNLASTKNLSPDALAE